MIARRIGRLASRPQPPPTGPRTLPPPSRSAPSSATDTAPVSCTPPATCSRTPVRACPSTCGSSTRARTSVSHTSLVCLSRLFEQCQCVTARFTLRRLLHPVRGTGGFDVVPEPQANQGRLGQLRPHERANVSDKFYKKKNRKPCLNRPNCRVHQMHGGCGKSRCRVWHLARGMPLGDVEADSGAVLRRTQQLLPLGRLDALRRLLRGRLQVSRSQIRLC